MRFDLHVHTSCSFDSSLDFREILKEARNKGLDGVCFTDHQHMEIARYCREGVQKDGLVVVFGMEYETPDGDFLIFGPFENICPSLSAPSLLKVVQQAGGAAVAAHPFRDNRPVKEALIQSGACKVIESVNGRNSVLQNLRTQAWINNYPLIQVGGSDAHTLEELGTVTTLFNQPVYSRSDLIDAIQKGHCRPLYRGDAYSPKTALVNPSGR